jgi:signal transduction histidine kinase
MPGLPSSIAARLVLGYGLLGMASIIVVSSVFYIGTIGVLDRNGDKRIMLLSERLQAQVHDSGKVAQEVRRQMSDGIDSDSEIFLVLSPQHQRMAGNLDAWTLFIAKGRSNMHSRDVVRDGKPMFARMLTSRLPDGGVLVVGHDQSEQEAIRVLVWRALGAGMLLSLLLMVAGALVFRRQIEWRIGDIRRTAQQIAAGDLSRRIPVSGRDEFSLLNGDINRMMDRIEHLMDGVRHVSNAIAHDLRTPLGRIRSKLDDAVRHEMSVDILAGAAHGAIAGIDDLIALFERLLQIAEAESGMRTQMFDSIDLNRIAQDIAEMYEASAEDGGLRLTTSLHAAPALVHGDRNLLASAVASLIDNAIKYAGPGTAIEVHTRVHAGLSSIAVCDNGPGIPVSERANVLQRFYRLDKSRSLPGNGLGLSIVSATATLHGGTFSLEDGAPGLVARISMHQANAG